MYYCKSTEDVIFRLPVQALIGNLLVSLFRTSASNYWGIQR